MDDDKDQTQKDTTYLGSERETEVKQAESGDEVLPGTGGPDDTGDSGVQDIPDADLQMPRDSGAH
jgi:hypothetical protein